MAEVMGKPEGMPGGIGDNQDLCAPRFMPNSIVPDAAARPTIRACSGRRCGGVDAAGRYRPGPVAVITACAIG